MSKYILTKHKVNIDHDRFPDIKPIRMVLLTDLHNTVYGKKNSTLLQSIHRLKPDCIMIAGDMINGRVNETEESTLGFISKLTADYPVYYANGNHEAKLRQNTSVYGRRYSKYVQGLLEQGVVYLENKSVTICIHGLPIQVYGLDISMSYYTRASREVFSLENMTHIFEPPDSSLFSVLLAHNPVYFETYARWGADLTLSGHLHGGMIRLPLLGGVVSPQLKVFPKYDKGKFSIGQKNMVVSAGMGGHSFMPRVGNPAELVLIELR